MGSISTSLTPTFNGQSSYASDLQTQLNREVEIASLPIQQMQSDVAGLQSQQQALSGLQSAFGSLQGLLTTIGNDSAGSLSASSSDSSVATATASSGAMAGTYTIQVDQVGTYSTSLSDAGLATVTDPTTGNISSSSAFTLTVNGTAYTISPSGTSLDDLATAINQSGAGVQATVVNVGSNTSPDYRLSLTASNVGATTIQLNDGTNDLMSALSTGADAEYSVDGSGNEVDSTSNQITLAPGLTVNLVQASSSPVTITVGANYNALSNDLANFATAYNSAVSTLDAQIGQNAGPLAGQSLIYTLQNTLNNLVNYTSGTGAVNSLASLGLTLNENGQMTYDSSTFNSLNISDVQQFLGSATSGGFLQSATNSLTSVADPSTGAIQSEFNSLDSEVTNEENLITNEETRVTDLTNNLTQQLSLADATIANLEEQKTYYTELFQAQYPSSSSGG
ncbi:MAG TPA: flagellar filament capping protein FliD [Bryobacteraceae bacterium]|nr:flagellar filament capping protein FliD [Bryobacteraceae bacterium]